MKLVRLAFETLFPEKKFHYQAKITYSDKFKDYNANIRLDRFSGRLTFSLSRKWKSVSDDIVIGLLQELMLKLFKKKGEKKVNTLNMDLYNSFLKNIHIAAPKLDSEPYLIESYFINIIFLISTKFPLCNL